MVDDSTVQGDDDHEPDVAISVSSNSAAGRAGRASHSTQFWITTAVGIAGVLVAALGVVAAWPKGADESKPSASISMEHADFAALSYEQQLDLCVPYVREHFERANQRWQSRLSSKPESTPATTIDDPGASGRQIMDMNRTVYDMAKLAPRLATAQNLMSCAYSYTMGDPGSEMPKEHGDQRPMERFTVEGESEAYTRGRFAGFAADGRPSKVIQIRSRAMPAAPIRQYGFTLMSGTNPANRIWVITAEEYPDMVTWVPDLAKWRPEP